MKAYTIIAGVNGVGKTSLTGVLKAERNDLGYVIDADKISMDYKLNTLEAGKIAVLKIKEFLLKDISFAQETTLSGQTIEKLIKIAKGKGYFIRLFYISLNTQEECMKRIKNRVEKGGHDIKPDDLNRRYKKRFHDLVKILPYCDETHLFDNENGFTEVGEYTNGELITKGDYKPFWLYELMETTFP